MSSPTSSARRIPSLDGLRAISIALVVLQHLTGTVGFPAPRSTLDVIGDIGYLGVRVFFVISGYLITSLLVREHQRSGTISLRDFYARRAWRIFPAFYAYVAVMALAAAADAIELDLADVVAGLTYTMNYHYDRSWELGHLWSLSIEEQFYLVWPALLLLGGPRRVVPISIAMIVLAPLVRAAAWFLAPDPDFVVMEAYPCVMDSIAAGCLLAGLQPRLDQAARYQRLLRSPAMLLVLVGVLGANVPMWFALEYTINATVMNLGIALIVDRCVRYPDGPLGRALNWAPLVWLGTLSYSLYLWQQPFINYHSRAPIHAFPINLGLALACAIASYYLIERPFLAWRDRRAAARRLAS